MIKVLYKWILIVKLIMAGNYTKVNKILVWRTLKRYEENGNAQNQFKKSQIIHSRTGNEANVSYRPCFRFFIEIWKYPYSKIWVNSYCYQKTVDRHLARAIVFISYLEDCTLSDLFEEFNKRWTTYTDIYSEWLCLVTWWWRKKSGMVWVAVTD